MKKILLLLLILTELVYAQEKVTLTTPILADAGEPRLRVSLLSIDVMNQLVVVHLRPSDATNGFIPGRNPVVYQWTDSNAMLRISQLNTGNFSSVSLQKKLIQILQAENTNLAGVISGVPQ